MAAIAGDAHTPIYGYQFRAYFVTYKSGVPTAMVTPAGQVSLDAATFGAVTNTPVAIKRTGGATDAPNAYVDLTAGEMTAGGLQVNVTSTATDEQPIIIYPRVLPVWLTGTALTGGSTTTIKLAADAPAYDLCGCWVGVDSGTHAGQVRKISAYNPTTKIATVKRAFGGAPDGATYSILVPEAMQSAIATRAMLALPAYAPDGAGGLPVSDAGGLDLDTLLGELKAATDGTVAEIIKTCFLTLSNRTNLHDLALLLGIPDTVAHTLLTDIAAGNVTNVTGSVATATALGAQAKLDVNAEADTAIADGKAAIAAAVTDVDLATYEAAAATGTKLGNFLALIRAVTAGTFDRSTDDLTLTFHEVDGTTHLCKIVLSSDRSERTGAAAP